VWFALLAGFAVWSVPHRLQHIASALRSESLRSARPLIEWFVVGWIIISIPLLLTERYAALFALLCALLVLGLSLSFRSRAAPSLQIAAALFGSCSFLLWLLPELLAIDSVNDNRTWWIRFNIVLRFWPEGYYLIPLACSAALGPAVLEGMSQRRIRISLAACCSLLLGLFAVSHIPGISDRAARAPESAGIDGFQYMRDEHAADWRIVEYLAHLPANPQVVILEGCGAGVNRRNAHSFSMPGRIAVFSGRTGACGWSGHARLHNPRLQNVFDGSYDTARRMWVTEMLYLSLLNAGGVKLPADIDRSQLFSLERSRALLKELGVTHLILGEWERRMFGPLNVTSIAALTGGTVMVPDGVIAVN